MQSAFMYPEPVVAYLESEQLASRIAGPFDSLLNIQQVNRFGIIPKSNQPGKWRLILDLSYPPEHSVNDGINPQWCSLCYATVDQAIGHILQLGGALLVKVDVEHAYRNIPVHPEDRHLLGMAWRGRLYIDTALPFGLRSAPKIFSAVADVLEWVLLRDGLS